MEKYNAADREIFVSAAAYGELREEESPERSLASISTEFGTELNSWTSSSSKPIIDIEGFIADELNYFQESESQVKFQDLNQKTLALVCKYLDTRSAMNAALACSQLLQPARRRLYSRVVVIQGYEERKRLQLEPSAMWSTFLYASKVLEFFDTLRLGDPLISTYVEEFICFADCDWWEQASVNYNINDAWYLVAPLLTNLKTLIWPKLMIQKFQALPEYIRRRCKTLCVGFHQLHGPALKSCDSSVLTFPNLENLIINLENVLASSDVTLITNLLIWGESFTNVQKLTISGSMNKIICATNPRTEPKSGSQILNEVSSPTSKRMSLSDKLKKGFHYPSSPVTTSNLSSSVEPRPSIYSPFGGNIFEQIANHDILTLRSLTLDKLSFNSSSLDMLCDAVDLSQLKELELSNVLISYNDHFEQEPALLKLAPLMESLSSLVLDVSFQCEICKEDCQHYDEAQLIRFLDELKPLTELHVVNQSLEPDNLSRHKTTLRRLSFCHPEKAYILSSMVEKISKLHDTFWGISTQDEKSAEKIFKLYLSNYAHNSVLLQDCTTPNLTRLRQHNSITAALKTYKYQVLSLFGKELDIFEANLPNLEEISVMGIKFTIRDRKTTTQ